MKALSIATAVIALGLADGPALAQKVILQRYGGPDKVVVWKSLDAEIQAGTLIRAGVAQSKPALIQALVACIVEQGTAAVKLPAQGAATRIEIIEGAKAGCEGFVPVDAIAESAH